MCQEYVLFIGIRTLRQELVLELEAESERENDPGGERST
jgi:hypothetical protein